MKIIERERWNVMEQCMDAYGIDYKKSMKAFENLTNTEVYNYKVGYSTYYFCYKFKYGDPIYERPTDYHCDIYPENLCGKLLFRYINNNIMPYIIKGKYFLATSTINQFFCFCSLLLFLKTSGFRPYRGTKHKLRIRGLASPKVKSFSFSVNRDYWTSYAQKANLSFNGEYPALYLS